LEWWLALVPLLISTVLVYFSLYQIFSYLFRRHILWFIGALLLIAPFAVVFTQVSSILQVLWVLALTPFYGVFVLLLTATTWMIRYYCSAFAVLTLIKFLLQRKTALSVETERYEPYWQKRMRSSLFPKSENRVWRACGRILRDFSLGFQRYWTLGGAFILLVIVASTMVAPRVPQDPTYGEAMRFVSSDKTDSNAYVAGKYVCSNFARDFQTHALGTGYNCGYVTIIFSDWTTHALNCFNTTDVGLIFIEPQTDQVLTLKAGDAYFGLPILDGSNVTIKGFYVDWEP
jgi:hypothetical protein